MEHTFQQCQHVCNVNKYNDNIVGGGVNVFWAVEIPTYRSVTGKFYTGARSNRHKNNYSKHINIDVNLAATPDRKKEPKFKNNF